MPDPKATLKVQDRLTAKPLDRKNFPDEVHNALAMHNQTIAACESFHTLFCERHKDGKPAEDHYEQDLLRAMLLFACSGLDATVKQLVRDGLEEVVNRDAGAQQQFSKFIERRLKRGSIGEADAGQAPAMDFGVLASVLAAPEPRKTLIMAMRDSLTGDSLQSRDQLLRVAGHFALGRDDVLTADKVTKEAFEARNQVAHEMDIDFRDHGNRRDRAYGDMVRWSENILAVGAKFIDRVSEKLAPVS